jgi:hypothetical protein
MPTRKPAKSKKSTTPQASVKPPAPFKSAYHRPLRTSYEVKSCMFLSAVIARCYPELKPSRISSLVYDLWDIAADLAPIYSRRLSEHAPIEFVREESERETRLLERLTALVVETGVSAEAQDDARGPALVLSTPGFSNTMHGPDSWQFGPVC